VYNYNRFQACRFGLDGTMVHPQTHVSLSLREDILSTLRLIEPHAEALGSLDALEELYPILHQGSDASFLRRTYSERGSLESVVDAALERFRASGV
jgi:carboxylate-amine ligase